MDKIKGFKGFDKNLKCHGYQFKFGERHEHKGDLKLCSSGFHFCEYPLDVFNYYPPNKSIFAEVEAEGSSDEKSDDSKRVCKTLHVTAEISIRSLIDAAIKFTFDRADFSKKENHATGDQGAASATGYQGAASATGDQGAASATGVRGAASATGYQGAASATGYQGAASATGDQSAASATGVRGAASATGYQGAASATGVRGAASATGKEGCAVALGIEAKVKGKKGSWLTVSEWNQDGDLNWHRIDVQTARVDGKKIKEDVFYQLKDGKFVVVTE